MLKALVLEPNRKLATLDKLVLESLRFDEVKIALTIAKFTRLITIDKYHPEYFVIDHELPNEVQRGCEVVQKVKEWYSQCNGRIKPKFILKSENIKRIEGTHLFTIEGCGCSAANMYIAKPYSPYLLKTAILEVM